MLNLRRLAVLQAVALHGSLSAAADELGYTASAISQQIATLEREVDARVLERHARGVRLTEAGQVLVGHAERLLAGAAAASAELDELRHGERGEVRLGWFTTSGAALLPQAIARLAHEVPGVQLELTEDDPDSCVAALRSRALDLALIYQFALETDPAPDLEQIVLLDDPVYVALPAGHPLAARQRLALTDFADEPWIQGVGAGTTLAALPAACRAAGFEPRVVFRTDDHLVVQGLVAAGVGVALLPHIALPTVRADIATRRVDAATLTRRVSVALAPGRGPSPAALQVLTALRAVAETVGPGTTETSARRSRAARPSR